MPKSKFVLQGFTAETHIDALKLLFELPDIQNILISVAYVTEGGVRQIEALLKSYSARATVFAGVRNDATSYQGLVRLHRIVDRLYTVDTGRRALIFHPKLYLVRANMHARMVIGSANLTLAGLHNNIEAGVLLDYDLTDAIDKAEIDKVELLFSTSLTDYPGNIAKVTGIDTLDDLLSQRRLIDEDDQSFALDDVDPSGANELTDAQLNVSHNSSAIPRMPLKTMPLRSRFDRGILEPTKQERDDILIGANVPPEALDQPPLPTVSPATGVESERESVRTFAFEYRKRAASRGNEGPRLKAGRLRKEAKAQGRKWYFTGEPCRFGHVEDRLVSNGKCRECNRQDSEKSNRLGLYR